MPWFGDRDPGLHVLAQLIAEGPDGNAQKLCRMSSVAEAMAQRLKYEMALDISQGSADEEPGRRIGPPDRGWGCWHPEVRLL